MSTTTPIPSPYTSDVPPPIAAPPEPPKKGHTLLWLVLGGLALLLAIGVSTFLFLASGDEEAAVVNDHSAQSGEPVFVEVPGYAYTDWSPSDAAVVDDMWNQANEDIAAEVPARFTDTHFLTSWSVHNVNRETKDVGFLQLVEINSQFVDLPNFDPDLVVPDLAGVMATDGTSVTTETIDGETVAIATDPDDSVAFAWYHEGTISRMHGEDEDSVRTFVEAYIAEQNS